jgi:hypothetical protein
MDDSGSVIRAESAAPVMTVLVAAPLCRRCVRLISRWVSDVPGVVSLEVDAARGGLRIRGHVQVQEVLTAVRSAGFAPVSDVGP